MPPKKTAPVAHGQTTIDEYTTEQPGAFARNYSGIYGLSRLLTKSAVYKSKATDAKVAHAESLKALRDNDQPKESLSDRVRRSHKRVLNAVSEIKALPECPGLGNLANGLSYEIDQKMRLVLDAAESNRILDIQKELSMARDTIEARHEEDRRTTTMTSRERRGRVLRLSPLLLCLQPILNHRPPCPTRGV